MNNISVKYKGNEYKFSDICAKIYANNDNCFVSCFVEFYDFNETLINQAFSLDSSDDSDVNLDDVILYPTQYSPYAQEFRTLLSLAGDLSYFNYNYTYPRYVVLFCSCPSCFFFVSLTVGKELECFHLPQP